MLDCRAAKYCRYYRDDAYTCSHEEEAASYCGARRQFEELDSGGRKPGLAKRLDLVNQGYD